VVQSILLSYKINKWTSYKIKYNHTPHSKQKEEKNGGSTSSVQSEENIIVCFSLTILNVFKHMLLLYN